MSENDARSAEWARMAAVESVDHIAREHCLSTASYTICGLMEAAAKLVMEDDAFAARIGALMEPPRWGWDQMDRPGGPTGLRPR
jgi:hypothetical protein